MEFRLQQHGKAGGHAGGGGAERSAGEQASAGWGGGGLVVNQGIVDIVNTTFANNFATFRGGAIFVGKLKADKQVTLSNSIFANNALDPNFVLEDRPDVTTEWQGYHTNTPLTDGGQNIQYPKEKPDWGHAQKNLIVEPASALIFEDPLLSGLADNGGPNQTMALQTGSPAIDAAGGDCPETDQRGADRVGTCDIGAFEFGGEPPEDPQVADPGYVEQPAEGSNSGDGTTAPTNPDGTTNPNGTSNPDGAGPGKGGEDNLNGEEGCGCRFATEAPFPAPFGFGAIGALGWLLLRRRLREC